ncbi:MAG TPA: response regulator [Candidatus Eremiobacteraeota bacterium]|nr:MAG: Alkaline phosphatase synthesis transcriptional regulatory protein PhoP [bacterium ADurb.Bin363]HPZ10406.1 response regulator [Candidatus Eremiobacteraeota bacterium]
MNKKILLVEDDPMILKVIQMILEEYNVFIATDGRTGVNKAKEEIPDIILMDLTLPVLDGYSALKEIKSFDKTIHIPVIALTAIRTSLVEIREKGFSDYLEKPFDPDELIKKIEEIEEL